MTTILALTLTTIAFFLCLNRWVTGKEKETVITLKNGKLRLND